MTADVTMCLVSRLLGHEFHFSPVSRGKSLFIAIHNITCDEPALDCVARPSVSLLIRAERYDKRNMSAFYECNQDISSLPGGDVLAYVRNRG